jgi:hypothetical protein
MKISSKDFRVREGDNVNLKNGRRRSILCTSRKSNTRGFWKNTLRN